MIKYTTITTQSGWLVSCGPVTIHDDPNAIIAASWSFNNISAALEKLKELLTTAHTKPK